MNIEQQVCSLELAKRLKELGVDQNGLFYYQDNPYKNGTPCIDIMIQEWRPKNSENIIINTECENNDNPRFSAFTVAELGNLFEKEIASGKDFSGKYFCRSILPSNDDMIIFDDFNEANARAKMLIYLIDNKLLPE